ncbi:conserved Plasmodium protein, unknown function [Plasmodium chabaudi chabaudi]|uniref:Uncharacterized protein n=1 Tax=Plasmodium chabaudi chabaudi TaxID=31271 RepID=A0A4V0K8Z0_PLACU|nr:conserved Plasmodium protein, unknown function [Plasmodium chabaudi chabaudi]VTZ69082.1 conserved Plasmodium protein, unknown function [Plasmodium chabaudi chabaudi]|eukprot:XP_016653932.1 conserved Plasmodium protein, unknown function [Plasmodium chabaudi chabaudi]
MAKKGETKSKKENEVIDETVESNNSIDEKENNNSNCVDPKTYNKFKNDGSFLQQVLALQKKNKIRKIKESETTDYKIKKAKKMEEHEKKDKEVKLGSEDEREEQIKNEYLEKIKKMKEEGLFTDKGLGAGLVK